MLLHLPAAACAAAAAGRLVTDEVGAPTD